MFNQILVPVDLNENSFSDKAVETASGILAEGGVLHLVSVQPGVQMPLVGGYFSEDLIGDLLKTTKQKLEKFGKSLLGDKSVQYKLHVLEGRPASGILKLSDKLNVDCIVMSSHKRSRFDTMMLGSAAAKVAGRAKVPVMVIKP